jgi:rhodanese-related sulfurtransferase
MRLGIGERERRAPGAAEHLPALDVEMLAELLDVVDEMPGGVFVDAGMRRGAAAAALVELHDAVT